MAQKTIDFLKSVSTRKLSELSGLSPSYITSLKRSPKKASSEDLRTIRTAKYRLAYYQARKSGATSQEAKIVMYKAPDLASYYSSMRKRGFSHRESLQYSKDTNRDAYVRMRDSGVTSAIAELHRDSPKEVIDDLIARHMYYAEILAKENCVKLEHIIRGMRYSDKTPGDWDQYISARKRQDWVPVEWDLKEKRYVELPTSSKRYREWEQCKQGKREYVSGTSKIRTRKRPAKKGTRKHANGKRV